MVEVVSIFKTIISFTRSNLSHFIVLSRYYHRHWDFIFVYWLMVVIQSGKKRKNIKRKEKFFKCNGGLLLQQQLSSSEVVIP